MLVNFLAVGICLWPPFNGGWRMADGGLMPLSESRNWSTQNRQNPQSAIRNPQSTADRQQLAKEYSRGWYQFYFINKGYRFLILFLILWTGFSARLRQWTERITQRRWGIILIYSGLFILLLAVIRFPPNLYAFLRENQYGFANQDFTGWLGDEFKQLGVSLVLGLPIMVAVYAIFKKAPRTWWLWGSAVLIGFIIFTAAIAPVFIAPLFNTFEPLRDQGLRQRILSMAHEYGIPADDVYQVDASRQSSHNDAYVVGLLGAQRIVLYDTLIENFTPEEVEFVMAHEMGHYRLHHVWKGIGLASPLILLGMWLLHRFLPKIINRYHHRFGFKELTDIASLPLLALVLSFATFALDPMSNSVSRYMERQADLLGLQAAPHPEVAFSVFKKFETLDLSEADPPPFIEFWLYSHPSLKHRIETAQKFLALTRPNETPHVTTQ